MRLRSLKKVSSGLFITALLLNVFCCNPVFTRALAEENVHTNTNETAAPEAKEGGESDSEQTEIGDGGGKTILPTKNKPKSTMWKARIRKKP